MSNPENYIVYQEAASGSVVAGTVVNVIIWNGEGALSPGAGLAIVADPNGEYPIGSVYKSPGS